MTMQRREYPGLGDALLPQSMFHELLNGKVSEIAALYDHYADIYEQAERGIGHVIHTYRGDGDPLPSFSSLPVRLDLSGEVMAEEAWDGLSPEHRVALYLRKGKTERIINRLEVADGEA